MSSGKKIRAFTKSRVREFGYPMDIIGSPTYDSKSMPNPDDEEFRSKLDDYFRGEVRALLAKKPEELRRDLFDELQQLLEQRKEVLEVHADFQKAKIEVHRHVKTGDGKPNMMPTRIIGSGSVPQSTRDVSERNQQFWQTHGADATPTEKTMEQHFEQLRTETKRDVAQSIKEMDDRNREFWAKQV